MKKIQSTQKNATFKRHKIKRVQKSSFVTKLTCACSLFFSFFVMDIPKEHRHKHQKCNKEVKLDFIIVCAIHPSFIGFQLYMIMCFYLLLLFTSKNIYVHAQILTFLTIIFTHLHAQLLLLLLQCTEQMACLSVSDVCFLYILILTSSR